MRTYYSSLQLDRFTTGQLDAVIAPRAYRRNRGIVIYAHGAGGNASEVTGHALPGITPLIRTLVEADYIVVAPTQTNLWGNSTSDARMDACLAWARDNLDASTNPPVIIGASHGGDCALTYALNNEVAAIVGIIPALDLEWLREQGTVEGIALRALIDGAWGVTYPDPLPAGANPVDQNPGVPVQLWVSTDDDISHGYADYAAAIDADLREMGALGHTDAAVAAVDVDAVLDFVNNYA